MRLATALGVLALGASGFTVTTLPRPAFPLPLYGSGGPHRLVLVSSRDAQPTLSVNVTTPRPTFRGASCFNAVSTANGFFMICGTDGSSGRYLVAYDRAVRRLYAFDFKNYAWPPRIKPGDREFVYEQPVWAQELAGAVRPWSPTPARSSSRVAF